MMKATINTETKRIKLEEDCSLKEILDFMKEHFPKDYLEYTVEVGMVTYYYPCYPSTCPHDTGIPYSPTVVYPTAYLTY